MPDTGQKNFLVKQELSGSFSSVSGWFIFILLLSNALLPPYVVTVLSVLYFFYYMITSGLNIPRDMIRYLLIPMILIIIGIAGSRGNLLYDALKDGWYYLNPIIVLCAGYLTMRKVRSMEPVLELFVIGGFLLAVIHIFTVMSDPSLLFEASVREIRAERGSGYFLSMISLCIILFSRKLNIKIFQSHYQRILIPFIIAADSLSLFLSFSRTMWASFILFYLVGKGWVTLRHLKGLLAVGIMIALFQILVLTIPEEHRDYTTMIGKIAGSLDEIIVSDYVTRTDIQKHWRGYESYMAMKTYLSGGVMNIFFGHGFGKLVDLKIYMRLGGENFRLIPVMHNGYMYVLVKTGITGLLLYLLYLFIFLKTGLRYREMRDERLIFAGRFIVAISLTLFLTTLVIAGMFNKSGLISVILMLGALLSYVKIRSIELAESEGGDK